MDVYLFSGSGFAWRVILACEIKGIDYKENKLHVLPDELHTDEFLKLNPRGKVPVIDDHGYVLSESMAILAYLDRKYPEKPLLGATAEEAGLIWRAVLDFDLYMAGNIVDNIIIPIVMGQSEAQENYIKAAAQHTHNDLALLEAKLSDRVWLVGETITAADIAAYTVVEPLIRFTNKPQVASFDLGFDLIGQRYPALHRWRQAVQRIDAYKAAYPAFWRQVDEEAEVA